MEQAVEIDTDGNARIEVELAVQNGFQRRAHIGVTTALAARQGTRETAQERQVRHQSLGLRHA